MLPSSFAPWPCEGCGRGQALALSYPDTRTAPTTGVGWVLCEACHDKGKAMSVADAVRFYTKAKGETP